MAIADRARSLYPWMPPELVEVYVDAYTEYGESNPALVMQEVRNGEGRQVYDSVFPGNRRPDGTLRLTENQYFSTRQRYENSLRERGLDPGVFDSRISELIANEVSADEFESRIAAVNENIALQGEEVRRAFAEASGITDFSQEAALATVLDPDGVGRELLERRISVAQVSGAAAQGGFEQTTERVNEILNAGVDASRARQFFSGLGTQVNTFNTISQASRGSRGITSEQVTEAVLLQDQQEVENLSRLLARERSAFTSRRGMVQSNQRGETTGLSTRRFS